MDVDQVKLWVFPASDFPAWQSLVGDEGRGLQTYSDYLRLLAATQADQERAGREVVRVGMRVASMESLLASVNLENTPQNRAAIIAQESPMIYSSEWAYDFVVYRLNGATIPSLEMDVLLDAIIEFAAERGYFVGGGFGPHDDAAQPES